MKKLILGIFLLSPAIAIGQVQTYFNMGYGQFKMSDMKAYQNDLNSAAIVPTKTTSSFPAFWIYDWGATYTTHSNVLTGLSFGLGSTGGRVTYSDYSGTLQADQRIQYLSINANLGYVWKPRKWIISADLRPGFVITGLELKTIQQTQGSSTPYSAMFGSVNIALQPTVTMTKRWGHFSLQAYAGYNQTIARGRLVFIDDNKTYLVDNNNQPITADWSGLRAGAGVSVFFGKRGMAQPLTP